jgi:U3 small nucleolar ribonucleoprotein protein LCP5
MATLTSLLSTLTESLSSATSSLPDQSTLKAPQDGISLLDTKNELLLSYLHNLVFLIMIKLRDIPIAGEADQAQADDDSNSIRQKVVKKLVELRVYLEKGVKPLEGRLRYQIDKVVRAAEEEVAKESTKTLNGTGLKTTNGHVKKDKLDGHSDDDSDASDASSHSDDESSAFVPPTIDPLAYRPNPSALTLPSRSSNPSTSKSDGIYRPPRITPTSLPTTTPRSTSSKRLSKSATLEEFVSTELSTAPIAEPSIGSTIMAGGRRSKSHKEKEVEKERKRYEESNYIRLPREGKKVKGGRQREGYGGEEWRGLGEGAERVVNLTRKGSGGGALERSRKRVREDDGGRGEIKMGEKFERRRQNLEKRRRR